MKKLTLHIVIVIGMLGFLSVACAEENSAGEGAEQKAKPPEKAKPDSAVSFVANLPEVKKWQEWVASQNNGRTIAIWGEEVLHQGDNTCSGVAVAETDASGDNSQIWVRFCVTPGGSILVETKPKDDSIGDLNFMPYDEWKKKCHPTYKSPGTC